MTQKKWIRRKKHKDLITIEESMHAWHRRKKEIFEELERNVEKHTDVGLRDDDQEQGESFHEEQQTVPSGDTRQ